MTKMTSFDNNELFPILMESIVITDTMKNNKIYNGSEEKFGIVLNDADYIVKLQKKDWLNVQAELVASRFIQHLGGNVHRVKPGLYKGIQVVLCKDFTQNGGYLKSLKSLNSSCIDTDPNRHEYYFEDVIYELTKIVNLNVDVTIDALYNMILFDSILANTDRHSGNWGIYYNKGKREFSTIFDNGACLFPRNKNFNITKEWMLERTFVFPNSKLMFCEKPVRERITYLDIWHKYVPETVKTRHRNLDVVEAMSKTCNDFGLNGIIRSYYLTIVYYRYQCIVLQKPFQWKGMIG